MFEVWYILPGEPKLAYPGNTDVGGNVNPNIPMSFHNFESAKTVAVRNNKTYNNNPTFLVYDVNKDRFIDV